MLGTGWGRKGEKAAQPPDVCGLIPLLGGPERGVESWRGAVRTACQRVSQGEQAERSRHMTARDEAAEWRDLVTVAESSAARPGQEAHGPVGPAALVPPHIGSGWGTPMLCSLIHLFLGWPLHPSGLPPPLP